MKSNLHASKSADFKCELHLQFDCISHHSLSSYNSSGIICVKQPITKIIQGWNNIDDHNLFV